MESNTLEDFLKGFDGSPPEAGTVAQWRSGISVAKLQLRGERLGIGDAWQVPSGLNIPLAAGDYEIEAVCAVYGSDARVARIQVRREGLAGESAELLGRFDADVAAAGVFDADAMLEFANRSPQAHQNWADRFIDHHCESGAQTGRFACRGARTSMVFFPTGFGDGSFPVYALRRGDELIGVEAVFIPDDTPYPFDGDGGLGGVPESDPPWRDLGEQVVSLYGDSLPDRDCRLALELEFHVPDPGALESFLSAISNQHLTPCTDAYLKWSSDADDEPWNDSPREDGVVQAWAGVPLDIPELNGLGERLKEIAEAHGGEFRSWNAALDMRDGEPQEMARNRALEFLEAGDLDQAIGLLSDLVALSGPFGQECWEVLGVALCRRGDLDGAVVALRRALKVDPASSSARVNLGLALILLGKRDEAAQQWLEVLRREPEHATAHYNLACVAAGRGDSADALRHLRFAVRNPKLRKLAKSDADLRSLADNPQFKELLKRRPAL